LILAVESSGGDGIVGAVRVGVLFHAFSASPGPTVLPS
jgi:hypothetical protein